MIYTYQRKGRACHGDRKARSDQLEIHPPATPRWTESTWADREFCGRYQAHSLLNKFYITCHRCCEEGEALGKVERKKKSTCPLHNQLYK